LPSLIVAVRCQYAEELGRRLRRRYQRQERRMRAGASSPQAEAELAERIDGLLDPVK
jgi:hypothetical protein